MSRAPFLVHSRLRCSTTSFLIVPTCFIDTTISSRVSTPQNDSPLSRALVFRDSVRDLRALHAARSTAVYAVRNSSVDSASIDASRIVELLLSIEIQLTPSPSFSTVRVSTFTPSPASS